MAETCPPRRPVVGQLTIAFQLFTSTTPTLPEAAPALTARCNRLRSSVFGKDGCDVLSFTKQPDDIEVVVSLEVEPRQWKLVTRQVLRPGMSRIFPNTGDPMPGSTSIWSSAAFVAFTSFTATLLPASFRSGSSGPRFADRAVPGAEESPASNDLAASDRQQFLVICLGPPTS